MGGMGPGLVTEMVGLGCRKHLHCLLVLRAPVAFENWSSISIWGEQVSLLNPWQNLEAGRGTEREPSGNVPEMISGEGRCSREAGVRVEMGLYQPSRMAKKT